MDGTADTATKDDQTGAHGGFLGIGIAFIVIGIAFGLTNPAMYTFAVLGPVFIVLAVTSGNSQGDDTTDDT